MHDTDSMGVFFNNQAETLDIKILDRNILFRYPGSQFLRNLILGIFQGKDYPVFPFPNYSPHIIVDVGANVGATALYFHAAFPEAQIYCYEPSRLNFRYLKKNTESFNNIHAFPYGLYDRYSDLPIYFGKDQCAQDSIFQNNETTKNHDIAKLVKVSEEISERGIHYISILKIDTEGCEVLILKDLFLGSENTLPIDMIYIEYHSEEDRLEIDRLTSNRFLLLFSKANQLHRGTKLYVSRALASKYPGSESLKIVDTLNSQS